MNPTGSTRRRVEDRRGPRGQRAPRGTVATWRIEGDPDVAWIKLDDKFAHDPKFRAIDPLYRFAAIGVWVTAIGFGQHYESDGAVRREDLQMLAPPDAIPDPEVLAELAKAGLFDVTDQGWCVHAFKKHNMPALRRAELRKEKAERNALRQRRFRRRQRQKESTESGNSDTVTLRNERDKTLREKVTPSSDRDRDLNLERENPPLPPLSHGASEVTGSNRSSLSPVLNPDMESLDDWKLTALRVGDEILRRRAAEVTRDGRPEETRDDRIP
jgi:hypothetical protein